MLLGSAAAKLAAGERGRRALASYGLHGRGATAAWAGTIALEAVLGVAVAADVPGAAEAAAVLLGLFTLLLVVAIARGRAGQPCGCFGSRSRIGWGAAVRSACLAAAFAVLPFLPDTSLSTEAWLGVGLAVALVGVAALAVALLALAREVGELRLAVAPQAALSLDHEGPELGGRVGLIERFERRRRWRSRSSPRPAARSARRSSRRCACSPATPRSSSSSSTSTTTPRPGSRSPSPAARTRSCSRPTARYSARAPSTRSTSWNRCSARRQCVLSEHVAASTSRRGFLARTGKLLLAVTSGGFVLEALRAQKAEAFHFCGHIYTTGSCPHPTGLPRIDANGFPLRAADGEPVDDLGRPVDKLGRPVDAHGKLLRDPDGNPLPAAPRTRICAKTGREFGFRGQVDGAWYRCCNGHIRKLVDCCGYTKYRINGDYALTGYCYSGRHVFCVMYYDTKIAC